MPAAVDRDLLFGMLALQLDFLTRDQLLAAMHAWVLAKDRPLGDLLVERGALEPERRQLLDGLVAEHPMRRDDDPGQRLASFSTIRSVRESLEAITDPDLHTALDQPPRNDAGASAGTSTSSRFFPDSGPRFRKLRLHARGGLGEVYVARDEELQREVALKEIQDRHADHPESRARFLVEGEITGRLEHPGIVPVYGLGQYADGRPFYAMRFIRGDSLKKAIEEFHQPRSESGHLPSPLGGEGSGVRGPGESDRNLQFRQLLRRFLDVCNAVQYAHDRGVLHRDLKPGNIMLGKYGETLVVDWGLAKAGMKPGEPGVSASATGEKSTGEVEPLLDPAQLSAGEETVVGTALGTPQYMSPEQAAGRLDLLGPASDVYSLGATLYTLLTGLPPVEGKSAVEVLDRVRRGEIVRPRQAKPDVPAALDAVCRKAMAPEPAHRYPSPRALADDIDQWLADEPVGAWPEPWTVRTRRWIGKHRTAVTGAAAALVVGSVFLTLLTILLNDRNAKLAAANQAEQRAADQARRDRDKAKKEKAAADAARAAEEAARRRTEGLLYGATIREAVVHCAGDFIAMEGALRETGPDLRGPEFRYLSGRLSRSCRLLGNHQATVTCLCPTPDGRIISGSLDHTIRIWHPNAGKPIRTLSGHRGGVSHLLLAADGKRLFSASGDRSIKEWAWEEGKEIRTFLGHAGSVTCLALAADGRRLFSGSDDKTIKVWDLETGKESSTLRGHDGAVWALALAGDGTLYSAGWDDNIKAWDLETGKERFTLRGHSGWVTSLACSPRADRLYSGSEDHTIRIWDLQTRKPIRILRGHTGGVWSLAQRGDGKLLYSTGADQTIRIWHLDSEKPLRTLHGHSDWVWSLALTGDGKRLYSGSVDRTIKGWDLASEDGSRILSGLSYSIGCLVLAPGTSRLYSSGQDRAVTEWDWASGKVKRTFNGHQGAVACLATDGTDRRLFSGSYDRTIKEWDLIAGKEGRTLRGHSDVVAALVLSADGRRLFSASSDRTIKEWDLQTGSAIRTFRGHTQGVRGLALAPDGKRLFSGSWDHTIKVWNLADGDAHTTLRGHTHAVSCLVPSQDGRFLYSASFDRTIKVWDLETGKETATLRGHSDKVGALALSADGRRLFSGSYDRTVKVWDLGTGKEIMTLAGQEGGILSLALAPADQHLFSGGRDGIIKIWPFD